MKILLIAQCFLIAVIWSSCGSMPGHYLTKHDPSFFDGRGQAKVAVAGEITGIKTGAALSATYAFSDHWFAGVQAGINRAILYRDSSRGYFVRPVVGYFFDFAPDDAMYCEIFAGAGLLRQKYQLTVYNSPLESYGGTGNALQFFGGVFIGCRMERGKKIGFDLSYEYSSYRTPVISIDKKYEFNNLIGYRVQKHDQLHNLTTSFYVSRSIKNLEIYFNPGLNIGFAAILLRLGFAYHF